MTAAGASMCTFMFGGPKDGAFMAIPNHIRIVEMVIFTFRKGVIVPSGWVHAYVRIEQDTFVYDGVRQCGDSQK